jgi:hypothetical protein
MITMAAADKPGPNCPDAVADETRRIETTDCAGIDDNTSSPPTYTSSTYT